MSELELLTKMPPIPLPNAIVLVAFIAAGAWVLVTFIKWFFGRD